MIFTNKDVPYRVCCTCYFEYHDCIDCWLHEWRLATASPHSLQDSSSSLTKDNFQLLRVIGRGSFGKVLLVRGKQDKKVYALKILSKSQVVARKQVEHTQSERKILEEVAHPFLCPLEFAFQTEEQLYFGMPFLAGGSLFYHLQQVCFEFAEILQFSSQSLQSPLRYHLDLFTSH